MIGPDERAPAPAPDRDGPPTAAPPPPREIPRDRRGRAKLILEILDHYIPAPSIPLDHANAFQLLVAVILSAQCTDARVNLVTPALFARAPDARAMARLSSSPRSCRTSAPAASRPEGARASPRSAGSSSSSTAARCRTTSSALEALPGVGHKTASVVMAQAFGVPAFPVDTHIHRLAGRWRLSRARTVEEIERDLKQLFPRERWTTAPPADHLLRPAATARRRATLPSACPICSWAMSRARALREERQGLSKPAARPKPRPRSRPRRAARRKPRPRSSR